MYEYNSIEILEPRHRLKQSQDDKNKNKERKQLNHSIHTDEDQESRVTIKSGINSENFLTTSYLWNRIRVDSIQINLQIQKTIINMYFIHFFLYNLNTKKSFIKY